MNVGQGIILYCPSCGDEIDLTCPTAPGWHVIVHEDGNEVHDFAFFIAAEVKA